MKLTTARTYLALAALTVCTAALPAQSPQPAAAPQATQPATPAPATAKKTTAQAPAADAMTAAAPPQKGMVWVNTASGVYHMEGTKYYGKTKKGKYMTEADAQKAGYHAAKAKP